LTRHKIDILVANLNGTVNSIDYTISDERIFRE